MTAASVATGAHDRHACLFERHPGVYAFCREHLFRDDTSRICQELWPDGGPLDGMVVLELGCGPGLYARRLAGRFPGLRVVGVDHSMAQLRHARRAARAADLAGCSFVRADVRALPFDDGSVDAVVVSRLFIVLDERAEALAEMHRVLRPGGRAFVAEPLSPRRAAMPLAAMRLLDRAQMLVGRGHGHGSCCEDVEVMDRRAFRDLTEGQPWASIRRSADRWYQYAVCERAA